MLSSMSDVDVIGTQLLGTEPFFTIVTRIGLDFDMTGFDVIEYHSKGRVSVFRGLGGA